MVNMIPLGLQKLWILFIWVPNRTCIGLLRTIISNHNKLKDRSFCIRKQFRKGKVWRCHSVIFTVPTQNLISFPMLRIKTSVQKWKQETRYLFFPWIKLNSGLHKQISMVTGRPSGLRRCDRIRRPLVQTPLRARTGLGSLSPLEVLANHQVKKLRI